MSAMDFEYAIKKDVRNNPIVREVDEARQRALLRSTVIGGLLVAVVLFSVWQKFQLVSHGYAMETLQRQRSAEEEVNRHLRLEIETLRSPRRIEELRNQEAAPGAAAARQGHRHRASDGARAAVEVDRRRALARPRQGDLVAEQQGRTFRLPWPGRRPASAPVDWRTTIRTRLVVVCRALRGLDRRHRSAAGLPPGRPVQHASSRARRSSRCARSPRRRSAAKSSIATGRVLAYSVDADSVFADPAEIEDPDVGRVGGVRRLSTSATRPTARRWRRSCAAAASSPTSSARFHPTKSSGSAI